MFEKVKAIIAEKLNVDQDEIKLESSIVDDLGADSIDLIELIMNLEEEYGISISDEEAVKLKTVGDVVDFINSQIEN
ncbi:acyl carrier protein [Candidatus Arthromitus sp. SFB-turkey]|uniref:acyl carrier protein n=1 Tax=Candidatus Arthromitus sp. SFB-turkey TaxID=1840217 RepID=UPI0007F44FAB|nr:acyl carrier protein [Candidatus Arthromitus sp. SFB-turkey]OAT87899.1 acyl carrier protein [Candidatus Arthromitus sp. SFB-turkey]HJD00581.1 acyl carrier protein [Candidatus Dwaynia gallinarum]